MIDHVVWIVPSLEQTATDLERDWGLTPAVGGKHPAHGTHNMLLRLGPRTYLEILAPDPEADPDARSPRGQMVAATTTRRLHETLLNVADFDAATTQAHYDAYRVTGIYPGERHRPDGSVVRWRRAELETANGVKTPDVIEWVSEHPASSLPDAATLRRLTLHTADPDDLQKALQTLSDDVDVAEGTAGLTIEIETPKGVVAL